MLANAGGDSDKLSVLDISEVDSEDLPMVERPPKPQRAARRILQSPPIHQSGYESPAVDVHRYQPRVRGE